MSVPFPEIHVGEPIPCGGLTVFPLGSDGGGTSDYILAHEGMESGTVVVREVSDSGSIPELSVDNGGNQPVLFLEGIELRGARQNRLVCDSVLVAAKSQTNIGVICTERGRWADVKQEHFTAGAYCPPTLRYLLKQTSRESATTIGGHRPSQITLWKEIRRKHFAMDVMSETEDLLAVLEFRHREVEELQGLLPCPESAHGIAVASSDRVCADIFDKAATLRKVWDRMVLGLAIDQLELGSSDRQPSRQFIAAHLGFAQQMAFQPVPSVGLGEMHRSRCGGMLANALVVDGIPVHFSVAFQ